MVLSDELDVDVLGKGVNEALKGVSPSGLVPCLQVAGSAGGGGGDFTVWETLSIIEFLHEAHPGAGEACCMLLGPGSAFSSSMWPLPAGVWPEDRVARAAARSLASEMASGFCELR